jgi:hypothetical protein
MLQKFLVVFSRSLRQMLAFNLERDRSSSSFFVTVRPLISLEQAVARPMNTVGAAAPSADGMQQWHNPNLSFGVNTRIERKDVTTARYNNDTLVSSNKFR